MRIIFPNLSTISNIIYIARFFTFFASSLLNLPSMMMNPLDAGPQNVLGKRPNLVDPLVLELIARIEPFLGQPDIEFEGRLGLLAMPSGGEKKSVHRLPLPVITETVVEPSGSAVGQNGKPFKYEFIPDLGKTAFERIQQRLDSLMVGKAPPSTSLPNPLFKVNSSKTTHTVDEIYKKPTPCRLSYDWATYGTAAAFPVEVIVKESLEKMDVWAGHCPDVDEEGVAEEEGQSRHPFDYRFSINKERNLDKDTLLASLNAGDKVMVREKKRTTYDMKAWVVDMTKVAVTGQPGEKFEVEVELKRELLFEQLERRAKGKAHAAYQILTDFLYFIRDLAHAFGPGSGAETVRTVGGFKYPEMGSCEPSEDRKRRYRDTIGVDVFPIIGDYVFQIMGEVKHHKP